MGRYERQSMRALASSVKSFLDADDDGGGGNLNGRRRSAQAMILELFATHNSGPFNRLVAKAVGDWGVQELEVAVLAPTTPRRDDASCTFLHHCFRSPTGLKKLKLINCAPLPARSLRSRPLLAFSSLTMLVLQGMPSTSARGGGGVYERVIRACPALEVLHLKCCLFYGDVSIDAPGSHVTELVVDGCTFAWIDPRSLPRLKRLALAGNPMQISFGALPRLGRLNLSFYDDPNAMLDPLFPGIRDEHSVLQPSSAAATSFPDLDNLVVRFTGPETWIVPEMGTRMPWGNVWHLLVADMPRSWDISWTCRVLKAAPFLETLHIHFAEGYIADLVGMTGDPAIPSPPSGFKIRALREVVIVGFNFKGAGSLHAHFVRFLIRNSCHGTLEKVSLRKRGRVWEKGLWDWQVVATPQESSTQWSDEERDALFRGIQIQQGGSTSNTRIVLG
ncbi:hypothetical protein BS78_01G459900 [Paspalum vaginatum]|nr:hypothetical protein BS78_01G459900 [Paspalum vaginatum]